MYNEEIKRSQLKYIKSLKQILFRVRPEVYEYIERSATAMGYESMRKFYLDAINEKIERWEVEQWIKAGKPRPVATDEDDMPED